ncbi:MAG TPA: leucine-rich repeat domain-containing protein [Chitinophagaceae bacterium]|nr:leucine-rich repeat domain-containing protein [Chitinophagaceae bacterium]
MPKPLQTLLLVLAFSIGAGARLTVMGWLFFVGFGSIIILGIIHFYVHFYSMNSLATRSLKNIIKILLSHFFFITLFFFQSDGGDDRSHLVFNYIMGRETGMEEISNIILLISLLLYITVNVSIVISAKKNKVQGANHSLLISSLILSIILPFLFVWFFQRTKEMQEMKQVELAGEYSDIKRALKNKEEATVLRINPYNDSYSSFPKDILKLENLKELYLNEQKITSIPEDIGKLKNLEILDLVDNDINEIDTAICNCKNLRDLRIGGTKIEILPDCLTRLGSLTNLTIQSNTVNTLMDELRRFKTLKTAHFYTKGIPFDREKWWKLTKELGIE